MRLGFVGSTIPLRCDLAPGPVDVEWLLELHESHSLEVFVDQASRGSDRLRHAGVRVRVALKRITQSLDGEQVSSDALQALALRRAHEREPLDAIVYDSGMPVDYAWYEPILRPIPRGVALGAGPVGDLSAVWEDRRLFARFARLAWSQTGLLASADFLLSDVPPGAFSLVGDRRLPSVVGTGTRSFFSPTDRPEKGWVVVVATRQGIRSLADLMTRVVAVVGLRSTLTFVVITRPQTPHGLPATDAILADCPPELKRQTVIVPAGADGVAADCLNAAAVVVLASTAELAIPSVAQACRRGGFMSLEGEPDGWEPATFPDCIPIDRTRRDLRVVTFGDPSWHWGKGGETLIDDEEGLDALVVVHAPGAARQTSGLHALADLSGVDLVVWGRPDELFGQVDPSVLYPWALAVRGALWPALRRAADEVETIWDLICWAVSLEWIDQARLLVLPTDHPTDCQEVVDPPATRAFWPVGSGVLPSPRHLPVESSPVVEKPPPSPPIWRPAAPISDNGAVRAEGRPIMKWAQGTTWLRRARLSLPWRWGLLERAMRDRW